MTDVRSVLAMRNAALQRNPAIRQAAEALRIAKETKFGTTKAAAARAVTFAARFAEASVNRNTLLPPAPALAPASKSQQLTGGPGTGIASTLTLVLARVNAIQQQEDTATEAFEKGESRDIAGLMLARQKADISFEATLQVRNKLLAAYSSIMNMQF